MARALRALSAAYVERRTKLGAGAALQGHGKRAAFALFYGPQHYLLIRHIVGELPGAIDPVPTLVDLGCGTGAAGAGWATGFAKPPEIIAVDVHPWALEEAARTFNVFGLPYRTRRANIATERFTKRGPAAILAAFAMNELRESEREALMPRLLERAAHGDRFLIVEPIAGFASGWMDRWRPRVEAAGGRADVWAMTLDLPPIVAKLDRATRMDHRVLKARSLYIGSPSSKAHGQ